MKTLIAMLSVIAITLAHAEPAPLSLSFHELVAHPAKYNGKRVSVRAYLVTSCEHCGEFYADVSCARHHRDKHHVAIGTLARPLLMRGWPQSRLAAAGIPNDGFVIVEGTFRYNDITRPLPPSKDPNVETIRVGGFGWMGLDDKTITDITMYRPLGGHIPARIN